MIVVMMWGDPELEMCSIWDQEPDTGGVMVSSQPIKRQIEALSRASKMVKRDVPVKKKSQ